eukprot:CAMPEP_0185017856 /NCGR_PEP_ID=MMETSP1103-20130426/732_1 /TAXON_ID=36769 /ORGANISM="Paraphysomonas bandaiensis, Strain Caron Lab Isolate" /LENGTH=228 /DNA_ID=CAMNT_0027547451 /DNA_START=59 /DNA_END=742 /DNA_ORIENTATION=-
MALTLNYWNGRGLMEIPRIMLAISGKFPGEDYVDARHSSPCDNLEANLGRMPVITVGSESVGQSAAINFYVATECGLMGSSTLEGAQIIAICEHLKELMDAYRTLLPWGQEPDAKNLDKWFNEGAMDVTGPAVGQDRSIRYLHWFAGRIEACLGSNGFAVGSKLSLADVFINYVFAETLSAEQAPPDFPKYRREPFGDKERTDAALQRYPKIKASCDAVDSNANVVKW